jgi:hypothetical protein
MDEAYTAERMAAIQRGKIKANSVFFSSQQFEMPFIFLSKSKTSMKYKFFHH